MARCALSVLSPASALDPIAICRNQCDYRRIYFLASEVLSMPYYFEFDPVNRILRGRFEGPISDELLKEFYRLSGVYFERTGSRSGITDFSAATSLRRVSANDSGFGKFAAGDSRPGASALHRCGGAWNLWHGAHVRIGGTGYTAQSARGAHDERGLRDSWNHRAQVRAGSGLNGHRGIRN